MPLLDKPFYHATAGTVVYTDVAKPLGVEIHIRRVTLSTESISGCHFPRASGFLRKKGKTVGGVIALFNKRPSDTQRSKNPALVFVGDVEWPDGFELRCTIKTQNTPEAGNWVIEYDIIEPEKRRRWF